MLDPISLAGLGFTAVTIGSLLVLHFRKVEVPRVGYWAEPPNVHLHPGSPVTIAELNSVLGYWRKLGFAFGKVIVTHREPRVGGIYVTIPSQDWARGAAGRAWWVVEGGEWAAYAESFLEDVVDISPGMPGIGRIRRCQIVIHPGLNAADRLTSLRHEFGHALGFRHARARLDKKGRVVGHPSGHVLNPQLSKCGKGHRGIKP